MGSGIESTLETTEVTCILTRQTWEQVNIRKAKEQLTDSLSKYFISTLREALSNMDNITLEKPTLELEPLPMFVPEKLPEAPIPPLEELKIEAIEPQTGGPCYAPAWKVGDSGNAKIDLADFNTVRHGGAEGSEKKGNARFYHKGPGEAYWEFKVLGSGGFWLGVTTEANFGPMYSMKGLFFGGPGTLSDGGSLVQSRWGPKMEEGDVIGMRLEQKDGNTTLAFSRNGKGLGTAFDIQGWDEGVFVPAVSLEKPGQGVTINDMGGPDLEYMQPQPEIRSTIEGTWKLNRPGVEDHVFEMMKDPNGRWIAHCTVANSMSCDLEGDGPEFKAGPVRSTMMMPPPHLDELEREMGALMEGITSVEWELGCIVVTSGGNAFRFKEFNKVIKPATKDMINWMNK